MGTSGILIIATAFITLFASDLFKQESKPSVEESSKKAPKKAPKKPEFSQYMEADIKLWTNDKDNDKKKG
jgi:hypothetical protein